MTSVVRASDRSFQVKWTESAYERGNLATTQHWTGILSVVVRPPASAETLRKNPLGLYVDAIDWSQELDPPSEEVPSISLQSPALDPLSSRHGAIRLDKEHPMTRPLILAIALAADLSACAAAAVPAPRSAADVQAKRIVASAASEGLAEGSAVTAATARDAPGRGRRKHGAATPLARAGRLTGSRCRNHE